MAKTALEAFVADVRSVWGPINSDLVRQTQEWMNRLTSANEKEDWLASLLSERPATRELHRDPSHGFMLLAHGEQAGLYRAPHDHGRAWVCYAVQSGELEISTYVRVPWGDGSRLVRRETHILRPGHARLYFPGDIHDTRCLTEQALVFRFTERDLRHEDQVENKLTRFIEQDGHWVSPPVVA
ncbi:cupin domain-containing protein [Sphingomonas edaphi]|uniref:Cysteine dioxygenase n=1 Tax=Sphingomonas edaphi TaxID=2315689 RepID=A0A418PYL9_9SPHN|nr:hypothetical protein [Sphingomonas edaphi]RIX27098.1 hypothetical protein D3M59_11145 [Sphingomonas edaphi]